MLFTSSSPMCPGWGWDRCLSSFSVFVFLFFRLLFLNCCLHQPCPVSSVLEMLSPLNASCVFYSWTAVSTNRLLCLLFLNCCLHQPCPVSSILELLSPPTVSCVFCSWTAVSTKRLLCLLFLNCCLHQPCPVSSVFTLLSPTTISGVFWSYSPLCSSRSPVLVYSPVSVFPALSFAIHATVTLFSPNVLLVRLTSNSPTARVCVNVGRHKSATVFANSLDRISNSTSTYLDAKKSIKVTYEVRKKGQNTWCGVKVDF